MAVDDDNDKRKKTSLPNIWWKNSEIIFGENQVVTNDKDGGSNKNISQYDNSNSANGNADNEHYGSTNSSYRITLIGIEER